MKGLDSYPMARDCVAIAFLFASIVAGVSQHPMLSLFLGITGVGLIISARKIR